MVHEPADELLPAASPCLPTARLYVSLLPPPLTALSSSGKKEGEKRLIIPRPSVKLLRLGGAFTDDAPSAAVAETRNVSFGWPQGEILTHIAVAKSRYPK